MKRITVVMHVDESWMSQDVQRRIKTKAAADIVALADDRRLSVTNVNVKIGNVRTVKI